MPVLWQAPVRSALVDFHPLAFALIDLTAYHSGYLGQRHLKEEATAIFPDSLLYKGNVMLFLHRREDMERFPALAEEFQLKIIVSEKIDDLFALPALYRTGFRSAQCRVWRQKPAPFGDAAGSGARYDRDNRRSDRLAKGQYCGCVGFCRRSSKNCTLLSAFTAAIPNSSKAIFTAKRSACVPYPFPFTASFCIWILSVHSFLSWSICFSCNSPTTVSPSMIANNLREASCPFASKYRFTATSS